MSARRLREQVCAAVVARGLFQAGERVAVAVSGGLDSVCLLDILHATRGRHGGDLSVVTLDHGVRPDSAADADFVVELARDLGMSVIRQDLGLGEGSEATLRQARYAVFDGLQVDRVALAHHADDQAETVLMHLMRGTGTAGMAGMAWGRGRYVRPLLATRRAELVAYAHERDLDWREDATNQDPAFLRNRLRHEVLPLLESLRPGATGAIARSAAVASADDAYLDSLADDSDLTVSVLAALPEPLVRRILLRVRPDLGASHLDSLLALVRRGRGTVQLPGGAVARIDGNRLHL